LAVDARTVPLDLEIQAPAQAEHQLWVFVAMGYQVVAIVAQGKYRAGGHGASSQGRAPLCRISGRPSPVTSLPVNSAADVLREPASCA